MVIDFALLLRSPAVCVRSNLVDLGHKNKKSPRGATTKGYSAGLFTGWLVDFTPPDYFAFVLDPVASDEVGGAAAGEAGLFDLSFDVQLSEDFLGVVRILIPVCTSVVVDEPVDFVRPGFCSGDDLLDVFEGYLSSGDVLNAERHAQTDHARPPLWLGYLTMAMAAWSVGALACPTFSKIMVGL